VGKKNERVVAIIQARSTSKRLPNKALKKLGDKLVIQRVVDRVKAVNLLDSKLITEIVVATPVGDPIIAWCAKNKVKYFQGSKNDVLSRYYECAKLYRADWILRITGDCPLLEPLMVYGLLKTKPRRDYNALPYNRCCIPGGWDAELFSFEKLEEAHRKTPKKDREHVTKQMRSKFEDYLDVSLTFDFSKIKLDLDTNNDLRRLEEYVKLL